MTEHRLEVADVFRQHGQEFLDGWGAVLSPQQRKAFRDIGACRTAALGSYLEQCDHCSHQVIEYRSCRNRHCPKCHSRARDEWLADRAEEILPVPYCHGAKLGFLAVLHTWTQRLEHHPHVHCVVPAGGLSPDEQQWISPRKKNFFLPVKPLGCLFRGKFLAYLKEAFAEGRLGFYGTLRELARPARFEKLVAPLKDKEWVVYAKPPFGGPGQVLRYLARYTHRVAIANGRLLSLEEGRVRFRWRDSQDNNQIKEMSLDAVEFIRRFLLHVLPGGFVKIRHFGFLSNRNRQAKVQRCRELLPASSAPLSVVIERQPPVCPVCGVGHLHVIEPRSTAPFRPSAAPHQTPQMDSS